MGFYERHIGPRLVSCLCGRPDIAAERGKVVPEARGVVLEIGIGPGLNLPFYDPSRVERVIGVDPSDAFLRLGEAQRRSAGIPVEIIRAPAESLPLSDDLADTAVITYTLCSVEDPSRCLREVRRVLKPDGRVLFLEHGLSNEEGVARWQRRLNPVWRSIAVGCNLDRPVARMLEEAGFLIETAEQYYLPHAPKPIGFQCRGVASKPSAAAA